MSIQSNPTGGADASTNAGMNSGQHPYILNPLSNRSLSPANYQQLQTRPMQNNSVDKGIIYGSSGQSAGVSRKPASLGRKILGSGG